MSDLAQRIAELSPSRRLLLERLLDGKAVAPASGSAPATSLKPPAAKLVFDAGSSSTEARAGYRSFYNGVSEQLNATVFGEFAFFLNYGYVPDHKPQYARVQLPDHYLNRNAVKLVLELIGDCDIAGSRVLDVGCGRGGTVSVLHRLFAPRTVTGVDLSSAAISFCRKAHPYPRVAFLEADAEALPFRAGSFDVVTNLESSNSYPDIQDFYAEVFRVLSPGAYFLYSDVLPTGRMKECTELLKAVGFSVEIERNITTNILLSCDQTPRAQAGAFQNKRDARILEEFLGLPGSEVYEEMRLGQAVYKILKLKRAGGAQ
jgi:phthiocerol/phenolphthiocerol synthesis type-I polyketide synthase E